MRLAKHKLLNTIKIVLLAGGNSERFKGNKQLCLVNKGEHTRPLLQHSIDTMLKFMKVSEIANDSLYVISGKNHEQTQAAVSHPLYYCDQAYKGMGHTIAQAVTLVLKQAPHTTHILIALADQVALELDDYLQLVTKMLNHPTQLICAEASGITAPAIFPAQYFAELQALSGDKGAKAILLAKPKELKTVLMQNAKFDIDTQADLMRWNNLLK